MTEQPHRTVDHVLYLDTILVIDTGMDFPYCKTAMQGKQVCEGLRYSSQRLKDKVKGSELLGNLIFCLLVYVTFNRKTFNRSWVVDNLKVTH